VRSVLFNAARAAIGHPLPPRDFYNRLVATNRHPGKVALTALMRKMLIITNAVARDDFRAALPQTARPHPRQMAGNSKAGHDDVDGLTVRRQSAKGV